MPYDTNRYCNDVHPYTFVRADEQKHFKRQGRNFRLLISGAYNAYGLIGPEINGIVILDEDNHRVVCDQIEKADSGYYGTTPAQKAKFEELMKMTWKQFRAFVNTHPRTRQPI